MLYGQMTFGTAYKHVPGHHDENLFERKTDTKKTEEKKKGTHVDTLQTEYS